MPSLNLLANIGVHEAVPACMLSYLATGTIGMIVYARHGSIRWRSVGWLCVGVIPAAYLGSISLLSIPEIAVRVLIAVLMIFAGADALIKNYRPAESHKQSRSLKPVHYALIGAITGFGSAITGTGGPLIIVPIIVYLGLPVLNAIGLSQAIQLPVAFFASLGNWQAGNLNIELAMMIAAGMVLGSLCGALLVHRVPTGPLKKLVAFLLVFVGSGLAIRELVKLL